MLQNCSSVFSLIEHIFAWFLPIGRATIAQILFVIGFYDKLSVFNNLENLNKAYKVCSKRVAEVANSIVSAVLIPSLPSLSDSKLLSLPSESVLPFTWGCSSFAWLSSSAVILITIRVFSLHFFIVLYPFEESGDLCFEKPRLLAAVLDKMGLVCWLIVSGKLIKAVSWGF